ncbi:hypothetical protein JCM8097_007935 [Rhodosporidiobolus ruineniae]
MLVLRAIRNHHPLVHKVHKRACGEHAHPFRLPPLDASDIAQLERNNTIMQSFSRWIPNQGVSFTWKEFTRYISAPPAPDDLFRWFRLNLWIRQIDNHTRPSGILSPKQDLSTVFWQIPNAYLDSSRPPAISA